MTSHQEQASLEQKVFRYLYGDLTETERQRFEAELAHSPGLQAVLAEEQALDAMLPRGLQPKVEEARLQRNRQAVANRIAGAGTMTNPLRLLRHPGWLAAQAAALALAFALGSVTGTDPVTGGVTPGTVAALSPLDLVGDEDYELYAMEVNAFDAQTGAIDLTFALASETRFVGNVADAGVRALVDVALRNNIEDEDRLDAVQVLQYAIHRQAQPVSVPGALLYALREDSNPGVRYSAATSLAPYSANENVRDALRQALSEDSNPGVRLVAFDALAQQPDSETLDVFRQRMVADGNAYIRDRSRSIIDQLDSGGI